MFLPRSAMILRKSPASYVSPLLTHYGVNQFNPVSISRNALSLFIKGTLFPLNNNQGKQYSVVSHSTLAGNRIPPSRSSLYYFLPTMEKRRHMSKSTENAKISSSSSSTHDDNLKPGNSSSGSGESTASSASPSSSSTDEQPLSRREKLKQTIKDYGSTVLVFHITMSLCSLGLFYLLVSSGMDMVYLLSKIGISEQILQSKITQGASTFVVAYAVHKVFAPVRITITLTATPLIVKKLRSIGILKKAIPK